MRRRNWRMVTVGFFLIVLAVGFYLLMFSMAPLSNDSTALMHTVGTVVGAVAGISLVMIVIGLIGRKA